MKDIRLYIADTLVDGSNDLSLPITFTLEDFNNPTIVKNSWSKTISIPGTKNNNKLFGDIYKLDRIQQYSPNEVSGISFDPSKRVDFKLYKDANIVESGYMQLNDIQVDNQNITYNITLYGGIGDFFYNLKYNEDGTSKTLADLQYFIEDDEGTELPSDAEMDFIINKDFVEECFQKDWEDKGNKLNDFITFIPSYNGVYDDFDNSKCIINTRDLDIKEIPNKVEEGSGEDKVTYEPYRGYGLANLNRDYTEWEMRDLRSYRQRPAIKLDRLIETICRKENSGYDVTLDKAFFNKNNPYWSKTFVALPLLTSNDYDAKDDDFSSVGMLNTSSYEWGKTATQILSEANGLITIDGEDVHTDENGVITLNASTSSTINLKVAFQMFADTSASNLEDDLLSLSGITRNTGLQYSVYYYNNFIVTYLSVVDADSGEEIGFSNGYQFQSIIYNVGGGEPYLLTPPNGTSLSVAIGKFHRISQSASNYATNGNQNWQFITSDGVDRWQLLVNDCPARNRIKVYLKTICYGPNVNNNTSWLFSLTNTASGNRGYSYKGYNTITSASGSLTRSGDVSTGVVITKDKLLKTDKTPADFLLDYTKLFGLYFIKNPNNKEITICTRNNFFTGNVEDWSNRIDYSKNVTVTPILFDKKYYSMILDTPETRYANIYKNQFSQQYGQKRISTGYNFNYDTTNLYASNIYQSVIPVVNSDKYYRSFYNSSGNEVPAFLNDNCSYTLYSFNGEENDSELYGAKIISPTRTVEWTDRGKDCFAKSCFFNLDSNNESLQEISYALLMYNGRQFCTDSAGNVITFWITDDTPEMYHLNDGNPCFLYTKHRQDVNNNYIAVPVNGLPQYINCIIDSSNNITASLDFGVPKEIYIGNYAYPESSTIYDRFWKSFYSDQFNVNTKKVTCFVRLGIMNQSKLRDFYFFDNSYWVLNKVDSYDINSDNTVRCEFIKVNLTDNYTNGQSIY